MRKYEYSTVWEQLLTPEIVAQLLQLQEYKGKLHDMAVVKTDVLDKLLEIAQIQSTEASNKIEGIFTSEKRLHHLVLQKTMPRNRDEQEIAGYRDVLATLHASHAYIPPRPSLILQLHRDLYKYSGIAIGGQLKGANNLIAQTDASGTQVVRFTPVEAWETEEALAQLCVGYERTLDKGAVSPLLLIPVFILDFLCIHPFSDGNGRMSRLLTLLLLYREDFSVGKYISLEKIIEQTKESYYEALHASSDGWHENANNYQPFVSYMLGVLLAAYRDFASRVESLAHTKQNRVGLLIEGTLGTITKREILRHCPDISPETVERVLGELLRSGSICKISGGRYTRYTWNRKKAK